MQPRSSGIRRRLSLTTVLIVLAALPFAGCGSAGNNAEKRTRIAAALRELERELAAEKKEPLLHVTHGNDLLGVLTLFSEPPPPGISKAEWHAALGHDARIRRLEMEASVSPAGRAAAIELPTTAAIAKAGGRALAEYETGKRAVAASGCLACHRIGDNGNAGPGPDLTHVGARMPPRAIAHTLVDPTAPMPSFRHVPPAEFRAIISFLSQLK